jgi:thymidylate synthase (FAD)
LQRQSDFAYPSASSQWLADSVVMSRSIAPSLEEILGRSLPVLDDGFVRVVDYMGSDEAIVQAARVSYGEGTKRLREDRGLIRYLMRHRHTTPFEMCEIKLHVRAPMDCWRQWIRHRTASVNEYSTRYSVAINAAQHTSPNGWRAQSQANKQGSASGIDLEVGTQLSERESELLRFARDVYEERLAQGVAREQARKDLPLSTYTEAYWKTDLHNLLHFLELRMDEHAQYEIRTYAATIGNEIVKRWCPEAWEAFQDYRIGSLALSRAELAVVRAMSVSPQLSLEAAISEGFLDAQGSRVLRKREIEELEAKLAALGFAPPWKPK